MVTEKKIITDNSEIWIDSEGVLILLVKDDADLDLEEVTNAFNIYRQLGIGPENKHLQIIDARGNAQMSPEGRKYASVHGKDFFVASAVITKSLTIRLMVNFFNSFYKHDVPLKMFETEEAARKWLAGFRQTKK